MADNQQSATVASLASSSPLPPAAVENSPYLEVVGSNGAKDLFERIHYGAKPFTQVRSLHITLMPDDSFDDFDDDMWAVALRSIHPGNKPHELAYVRIIIGGSILFERNAHVVIDPVGSRDTPAYMRRVLSSDPQLSTRALQEMVFHFHSYERAVVQALCGIRGVQLVEIEGPIEPRLKYQIVTAMTTPPGQPDPPSMDEDLEAIIAADSVYGFLNNGVSGMMDDSAEANALDSDNNGEDNNEEIHENGGADKNHTLFSPQILYSSPPLSSPARCAHTRIVTYAKDYKDMEDEDMPSSDYDPDFMPDDRFALAKNSSTGVIMEDPRNYENYYEPPKTRATTKSGCAGTVVDTRNDNIDINTTIDGLQRSPTRSLPRKKQEIVKKATFGTNTRHCYTGRQSISEPRSSNLTKVRPQLVVINAQQQDMHGCSNQAMEDPEWLLPTAKGARVYVGKKVSM